jgi:hypothetical protein
MRYFTGLDTDDGWRQFVTGLNATYGFVAAHARKREKLAAGDLILCFVVGPLRCCGVLEVLPALAGRPLRATVAPAALSSRAALEWHRRVVFRE